MPMQRAFTPRHGSHRSRLVAKLCCRLTLGLAVLNMPPPALAQEAAGRKTAAPAESGKSAGRTSRAKAKRATKTSAAAEPGENTAKTSRDPAAASDKRAEQRGQARGSDAPAADSDKRAEQRGQARSSDAPAAAAKQRAGHAAAASASPPPSGAAGEREKPRSQPQASDKRKSRGEAGPLAHHQRYSLNVVSPTQQFSTQGVQAHTALRYGQETYYAFAGNSSFKEDMFGPQLSTEVSVRDTDRPLVYTLALGLGQDRGHRVRPNKQGSVERRSSQSAFTLSYSYRPHLVFALRYNSATRKIMGNYDRHNYFFAWEEWTLAGLYLRTRFEGGLALTPGLLKVTSYADDGEAYSLARPTQLRLHSAYRLTSSLVLFGKLDLLRQAKLNHQNDAAWANQAIVTLGSSYRSRLATFELNFGVASDGLRGISADAARRLGLLSIQAAVSKPLREHLQTGFQLALASGDTNSRAGDQQWVLTANQRSLVAFVSWQAP